uniref:Integral membrane bound transporter domain-containing protein n=1 Tax=Kalanchoe fedtschenkoi TaxID=63787 RepID=A0A7N0UML7_KALFE
MLGFNANQQAKAVWLASLHSAIRTTLACTIVAITTLYGPHSLRRHISLPAFSYVTIILVITDATLGDTLRGCWLALYASVQSLGPAMLTLWLIKPGRMTSGVTALAVALGGFVVVLPGPKATHLVSKRIALGQIVLVYVIAFINGPSTDPIMHPLHVAASTALGVFACVLALILPYPALASYQVKNKSELYAENALKRLKLYVKAFCAEERGAAAPCITQAKSLSVAGQKLLQVIKHMQEGMRWERLPFRFLRQYYVTPAAKLQELETVLRGMEISSMAAANNTNSTTSVAQTMLVNGELKEGLEEHLNLTEKQVKSWLAPNDSTMVPESNTEVAMKSLQTLQSVNPITINELPSLFFLFCFKLLHRESLSDSSRDSSGIINSQSPAKEEKTKLSALSQIWRTYGPGSGVTNKNLMAAFRCFLSLGFAVFLGLVYSKPDGYWAGLPVAISLASAREATFKVANLKAQGTVLGTVYAVLICYAFANSLPLRFMSLLPWFVFSSFLRKSKMYGQAGGLSAIIGAVLILGRKGFGGPKEFAIARIVETFIGLSCSVAVDIMFQPTRASTLAKAELAQCMSALQHCVTGLSLGESKTDCNGQMVRLGGCVNELSKYIGEAEAEPSFWFLPFNSASYNKLKLSFTRAADYLLFGSHAVQFLQQEASKLNIETWKDVAEKLSTDIKQFAETSSCLVQCFEAVSKLKLMTELEKTNPVADDIEAGSKSPNLKKLILAGQGTKEDDELGMMVRQYVEHLNEGLQKVEGAEDVKGQVMLCLGAIGFCMDGLMKEVREMERGVKEIIHWENPSCSHIDLYQISCNINPGHH